MTTQEFRRQLQAWGLVARKQKGLEVFDVLSGGTEICKVTYAELYPISDVGLARFLARKLPVEYVPPLG